MFTLLLLMASTLQAPEAKTQAPKNPKTPKVAKPAETRPEIENSTPDEALRTFMIAMLAKDEETLRAVTVKTEDFDWLLMGQAIPPDQIDRAKAYFAEQPIRALKPGDEVTLPQNRKLTVKPSEVTEDRAVLLLEGSPLPNRLKKIDGRWRVDATPIIAGRKAAENARKKAMKSPAPAKGKADSSPKPRP